MLQFPSEHAHKDLLLLDNSNPVISNDRLF
jgi:hypothetical protein